MNAALRNFILACLILQTILTNTLPLMYRFTEPGTLPQVYKTISPYLYSGKVLIAGSLRNIEIAADGHLLGCNTFNSVWKWGSVTNIFQGITGNLY